MTVPHKIADTFNEYGTPVTMFRCKDCEGIFTVCPAVEDKKLDQWTGCLGEGCASYDTARDGDKLFEQGKVHRAGDRTGIRLVEEPTQ